MRAVFLLNPAAAAAEVSSSSHAGNRVYEKYVAKIHNGH